MRSACGPEVRPTWVTSTTLSTWGTMSVASFASSIGATSMMTTSASVRTCSSTPPSLDSIAPGGRAIVPLVMRSTPSTEVRLEDVRARRRGPRR